ncbi:NAD(P)/FAD-dependent oxidoreductase [Micromonospora haikouensis]|uniref:NAD(P)/FAD-dependent oxidoreductase n=1 Tax=Micromonospora haikouensis TaxID=686309 RepID=UPI0037B3FBAF
MTGGTVIVGASLAGLRTAQHLRALGYADPVTLVGAEPHLPYDRPPLSKQVLLGEWPASRTHLVTEGQLAELRVDARLGAAATGLDRDRRLVTLADGGLVPYDFLVVATGSRPRELPAPNGGPHVHTLRTLDDARLIAARLGPGRRLVVIGAGFIGCEVACAAVARGTTVTLVSREPALLPQFGPDVSSYLARLHRDAGVRLLLDAHVRSVGPAGGDAASVVLADGTALDADVVVVGIGGVPNVEWLAGSGLAGPDGVPVSPHGQTADPAVLALGDVAAWPGPAGRGRRRSEHWSHAVEQAKTVARVLVEGASFDPGTFVPYAWSDQYGHKLQTVGEVPARPGRIVSDNWHPTDGRRHCLYLDDRGEVVGGLFVDDPRGAGQLRRALQRAGAPSGPGAHDLRPAPA